MLEIRPFRPVDLEELYAISLETGHEGCDASHLYEDRKLIGHIYSAPYAVLEPDLALVAEDEIGVAGFALGTLDTKSWRERLEADWWPKLRREYADPGATPSSDWSADQRRAFAIHHPESPPHEVIKAYPAHLHVNLRARIQGRSVGALLVSEWMTRVQRHGAVAVHVGVNRANERALRFWSNQGFARLSSGHSEAGRTIWMGRR
ncbi:GNAT family N-acetyltransferase [Terrarubrum flagellatum]|uniref:GNAT family N-acetyltransferase n=1 Tax=Terrirubrum flagellatum TaxID=2895980 RepID=UPI00314515FA